jgi:hypothetical protein
MPTSEESEILFRVGDRIEAAVVSGRTDRGGKNALFLARSTWNGLREIYFRVHDPDIAHAALQRLIAQAHREREWEYHMAEDAQWQEAGQLFRLYPMAKGAHS